MLNICCMFAVVTMKQAQLQHILSGLRVKQTWSVMIIFSWHTQWASWLSIFRHSSVRELENTQLETSAVLLWATWIKTLTLSTSVHFHQPSQSSGNKKQLPSFCHSVFVSSIHPLIHPSALHSAAFWMNRVVQYSPYPSCPRAKIVLWTCFAWTSNTALCRIAQ